MKTPGNIRQQLKQAQYRHLQKELRRRLKPRPHNCKWNRTLTLPSGAGISFCGVDAEDPNGGWSGLICDTDYGGVELAKDCPVFEPRQSKGDIKEEFKTLMASEQLGPIAAKYPDLAALKWVLDGEDTEEFDVSAVEVEEEPRPLTGVPVEYQDPTEPVEFKKPGWLARLWARIRGNPLG